MTLTAIVVGILICKTAWDIFRGASHQLTEGFDQELMSSYKKSILQLQGVKDLRARSYGNNVVVDTVILVNSALDNKDAHEISLEVERKLKKENNIYDVHVHVEPN